jgi:hypothetical protein
MPPELNRLSRKFRAMKISEVLVRFVETHPDDTISVRQMVTGFGERAFGFLTLVFALICIVPLPIPGIHMILSIPLFYLSLQQAVGRHQVWLPEKILSYRISRQAFANICAKTVPWIVRLEKVSGPRLEFLTRGGFFCLFGIVIFYITAFLSIPLPLTNLVPAIAIVIMAIGLLNHDGIALLIGSVVGIVWSLLWFYVFWKSFIFLVGHVVAAVSRYA